MPKKGKNDIDDMTLEEMAGKPAKPMPLAKAGKAKKAKPMKLGIVKGKK